MRENKNFDFTRENLAKAEGMLLQYPLGRQKSAVLALLDLAQRQNGGCLSIAAIEYVADFINQPYIRVYEIASFYSMFNLEPVGKYHIQVCGTTPCWLRGAEDIFHSCEQQLGIKSGETSPDRLFTLSEVECLGACTHAPVVQINDDYFEDLTPEKIKAIITERSKDNK